MYYEIPVPWVHHNLCNGMECSRHSMVKSPTCFQPATWMPEIYSSWEHIILYAKIIAVHVHVHVQCPNKLLHNNDGHGLTLHANIAQKNHTIDYHRLPRNDIARKNLSITLKGIFP